jgi:23S rRNA (uracil1939-C5)-methyltransferase
LKSLYFLRIYILQDDAQAGTEIEIYILIMIPGEMVNCSIIRTKQGFYSGKVIGQVTPSLHRVNPFCGHYHLCGGCPWQHIEYEYQLFLKRQILCNALIKYNIPVPEVPQVIPSPRTMNFRQRMEYTFASVG